MACRVPESDWWSLRLALRPVKPGLGGGKTGEGNDTRKGKIKGAGSPRCFDGKATTHRKGNILDAWWRCHILLALALGLPGMDGQTPRFCKIFSY